MTYQTIIIPFHNTHNNKTGQQSIFFDRSEFQAILNVYGKMVASGYWKDYAVSGTRDIATFAVFQKTSERPLYCITKNPVLKNKQGAFTIYNSQGLILKRGHELPQVLKYFEKKLIKIV